ncbi:hypothetical protein [Actinoplanes sp. NPDC051859]
MSSEPLAPTAVPADAAAERGLLIAMVIMVLLGVGGMVLMSG